MAGTSRDRKRTLALARSVRKKTVEHEGEVYEVRLLSHAERSRADRLSTTSILVRDPQSGGELIKSETDWTRFALHCLIAAAYDPETNQRVFEDADLEDLLGQEAAGTLVAKLLDASRALLAEAQAAAKNSGAIPKDNPSS